MHVKSLGKCHIWHMPLQVFKIALLAQERPLGGQEWFPAAGTGVGCRC